MKWRFDGLIVRQFACLDDNYGFLLHDEATGRTATVDTPDANRITEILAEEGWSLHAILNTHHHHDHVGGNEELAQRFGAKVYGPAGEANKIPALDMALEDGDQIAIGSVEARVVETPGHTLGHIIYVFDDRNIAFVGDTLFSLGCGRLFEGTPEQMMNSLNKIKALPPEMVIFCAHEYTEGHVRFTEAIAPSSVGLTAKAADVRNKRAKGAATVPMVLADELALNPFLRSDDPSLAEDLDMAGADPLSIFTEVRKRKDTFR